VVPRDAQTAAKRGEYGASIQNYAFLSEVLEDSLKRTPAGRLVTPEDMADAVLFLVSDLAKMVHGQTLIVDGGTSIVA